MSDHWRTILEHLPLVNIVGATAGGPKMIETKDLVGALVIGLLSAKGGAVLTTNELSVKLDAIEKQQTVFAAKTDAYVDQARANQILVAERLSRLEEKAANVQSGMSADRRPL